MSHAKREQSEFQQVVAAARARVNSKATPSSGIGAANRELRVLESWELKGTSGGDPYNGIGARAFPGLELRK